MSASRFNFRVWDGWKMHYPKTLEIGFSGTLQEIAVAFSPEDCGGGMITSRYLMQSTGLLSASGKELFEGDIVNVDDDWEAFGFMAGEIREVYFMDGGFRLKPKITKDNRGRGHWIEDGKNLTIIGNIFETPNLIKE